MCGISGIILREPDPSIGIQISAMMHNQRHRGPDGMSTWVHPNQRIALGHCRLAIVGGPEHRQPILDYQKNALTFGGEIYNYKTLYPEAKTDGEAILHEHRESPIPSAPRELRGMFAYLLWDGTNLIAVRDPVGIKPLYYRTNEKGTYFASEAKALAHLVNWEECPQGIADYETFQFYLGDHTPYRGIKQLEPGSLLQVDLHGQVQTEWYCNPLTEWTNETPMEDALKDSIHSHRYGSMTGFVSGGLDSSLLARMANLQETYTGYFADDGYNETPYVSSLDIPHARCVRITPEAFMAHFEDIMWHLDYPAAGPGVVPQYFVSQFASTRFKVALGGQGADELFSGYRRYRPGETLEGYIRKITKGSSNATNYSAAKEAEGYWTGTPYDFDFHTSLRGLLHVDDRMSMAHGLETRVPYLDREVIGARKGVQQNKQMLRDFAGKYLPPKIMKRTDKMGFDVPFNKWYLENPEFKTWVEGYVGNPIKPIGRDRRLWGQLCLAVWRENNRSSYYRGKGIYQ